MNNMFSGNREKKIPKTFNDCYKTDSVTNNLWLWAERLETIGIVLAIIVGIATFIASIVIAIGEYEYPLILVGIIAAPIAAFLEYISFHIIALLVGSLASIVQSTRISANIELFKYTTNNEPLSQASNTNTNSTNNYSSNDTDSIKKLESFIIGKTANDSKRKYCPHCGSFIKSKICDMCGKENNLF